MQPVEATVFLLVGLPQRGPHFRRPAPGAGVQVGIQGRVGVPPGRVDLAHHEIQLAGRVGHGRSERLPGGGGRLVVGPVSEQGPAEERQEARPHGRRHLLRHGAERLFDEGGPAGGEGVVAQQDFDGGAVGPGDTAGSHVRRPLDIVPDGLVELFRGGAPAGQGFEELGVDDVAVLAGRVIRQERPHGRDALARAGVDGGPEGARVGRFAPGRLRRAEARRRQARRAEPARKQKFPDGRPHAFPCPVKSEKEFYTGASPEPA